LKYFILLLFFYNTGFCQDGYLPVDKQNNVVYTDMGKIEKTREQLYRNAQQWITDTFGNYKNAVVQEDASEGNLLVSSYVPIVNSLYDYAGFVMHIQCSDNSYRVTINKVDGISQIRTPVRFSRKENDAILTREMAVKSETNRKKRTEAERILQSAKADNDGINSAMYKLMASLKVAMAGE
jgi:hypothetical protein